MVIALIFTGASLAAGTQDRTYAVRAGETASSIAEAQYGDPRLGDLLLAYNDHAAGTMRAGERIAVPKCRTHRVVSGETWSGLAEGWLGRASFGPILAELNGAPAGGSPRPGERVVVPIVLRRKLAPKESLASLAARFYGDPRKARLLLAFGRFPSAKGVPPGTIIGIPMTAFVAKEAKTAEVSPAAVASVPAETASEPPPAPPVAVEPARQFELPLRAATIDFVYGDYEHARAALEPLRGPVASTGNMEDRRELSQLLAFTYVALDQGAQACEAYLAGPLPRAELDPDLVELLFQPFYFDLYEQQAPGEKPYLAMPIAKARRATRWPRGWRRWRRGHRTPSRRGSTPVTMRPRKRRGRRSAGRSTAASPRACRRKSWRAPSASGST